MNEIPLAKVVTPPVIDYEKEGLCFVEGVEYARGSGMCIKMDIAYPSDITHPSEITHPSDNVFSAGAGISSGVVSRSNGRGGLPAVVWVHGGGWSSEELTRKYLPSREILELNKRGYVSASIDYRLCQTAPFPAQIEDCKAAVRFLRANASKYRVDPSRIAVWGESAGGHLAELMGLTDDTEFISGGDTGYSSAVQAVVAWYAPSDLRGDREDIPEDDPMRKLFTGTKEEIRKMQELASPISYAGRHAPPFLLMHGDQDRLVDYDDSVRLHRALAEAGNDAALARVAGQGHGFFEGEEYYRLVYDFLDRVLKSSEGV